MHCVPFLLGTSKLFAPLRSDVGAQGKGYWNRSRGKGRGGEDGREEEAEGDGEGGR